MKVRFPALKMAGRGPLEGRGVRILVTNIFSLIFPASGICPQRLQCSTRSGHENDPDSVHSAGPGVPETGSVLVLFLLTCIYLCLVCFMSLHHLFNFCKILMHSLIPERRRSWLKLLLCCKERKKVTKHADNNSNRWT